MTLEKNLPDNLGFNVFLEIASVFYNLPSWKK